MRDKVIMENELKDYFSSKKNIVIAIDGPAGSGKSTVADIIAKSFDISHFSMGSTFRSVAYAVKEKNIDVLNASQLQKFIENCHLSYDGEHVMVDGKAYNSSELKTMSKEASTIAANSIFHSIISQKVRSIVAGQNIVVDGRAMGSKVFVDASVKIFLDASINVRALRRYNENEEKAFDKIKEDLEERDSRDRNREYAPLVCNDQYYVIDTSHSSLDEVFDVLKEYLYLKFIVSENYGKQQVIDYIEDILSSDDNDNVYRNLDFFEILIRLLTKKFNFFDQVHIKKSIRLDLLNVMGNRFGNGKNDIYSDAIRIFPDIVAEAKKQGLALFEQKSNIDKDIDLYVNDIYKLKACVSDSENTDIAEKRFAANGSLVMLIKPNFSEYDETISEIVKRIMYHNCDITRIRVMNGNYFRKHKEIVFSFYEEAYDGYKSGNVDEKLLAHVKEKYDNPFFEFIFEEKYDDSMVFTAGSLIEQYNVSPSVISELWQFGRENISIKKIIEYLNLSDVRIIKDGIVFVKGESEYRISQKLLENGSLKWFHSNLCFGINKVCRSRSAFCVRDKRIRDGKTTIIINGHFQGLLDMFTKNEKDLVIALSISTDSKSSTMHMLRKCLSGNNSSPAKCTPGSIRRDGYEGVLSSEWDNNDRTILNGLHNIVHMSNGLLEGLKETVIMFEENVMNLELTKRFVEYGYTEKDISYLFGNPINETNKQGIFEITADLDEKDLFQQIQVFLNN